MNDETIEYAVPSAIGRYQIAAVLGQGSFAVVYRAIDPLLGRSVAIKVPRSDRLSEPGMAERLFQEAQQAALLRHPHIVAIFDVGRSDEIPCYIVMECIDGPTLAQFLKSQRLSHRDAAEMLRAWPMRSTTLTSMG